MAGDVSDNLTTTTLPARADDLGRSGPSRVTMVRRSAASRSTVPARYESQADDSAGDAPKDPLTLLLRGLKRRWKMAVVLTAIFGAAGMAAGYASVQPTWGATGQIRIRPYVAPVLSSSDENGMMPAYNSFVETQVALINSERVLSLAAKDPSFAEAGLPQPTVETLAGGLSVKHPRSTELINVWFETTDPQVAELGTRAIVNAFQTTFGEATSANANERRDLLLSRQASLRESIKLMQDQIISIAGAHGLTELASVVESRIQDQAIIRAQLRQLDLAIAAATASGGDVSMDAVAATALADPTLAGNSDDAGLLVEAADLRRTIHERDNLRRTLVELKLRMGPQHQQVRTVEARLAEAEDQVREQTQAIRNGQGGPLLTGTMSLPALKAQREFLQKEHERASAELTDLGRNNLEIAGINSRLDEAKSQLTGVERRLDEMGLESLVGGRIETINAGGAAMSVTGKKKLTSALAGSGAGAVLAFGIVLAFAGFDRSLRSIDDASGARLRGARNTPLWGAVPLLDEKHWTDEGAAEVNSAVHRMRVRMQLAAPDERCSVVAVTSPSSGDGKTSIATCLALSYAASGRRTLLIDADVIGQGVTQRSGVRARPRLGRILVELNAMTPEQVKQAVVHARARSIQFGQAAIELGYTTEKHVADALQVQAKTSTGLLDALKGKALANCITRSTDGMYYVMPLANADEDDAARVSPDAMRALLASARQLFEAIIIDSGPILGSIEASSCVSAADQVALIVRRGASRDLVELALNELDASGAMNRGIIFNRATVSDMTQSSRYGSLARSRRMSAPARNDAPPSVTVPADAGDGSTLVVNGTVSHRPARTAFSSTLGVGGELGLRSRPHECVSDRVRTDGRARVQHRSPHRPQPVGRGGDRICHSIDSRSRRCHVGTNLSERSIAAERSSRVAVGRVIDRTHAATVMAARPKRVRCRGLREFGRKCTC